jgi:hypothetical protein
MHNQPTKADMARAEEQKKKDQPQQPAAEQQSSVADTLAVQQGNAQPNAAAAATAGVPDWAVAPQGTGAEEEEQEQGPRDEGNRPQEKKQRTS